MVRLRSTHWIRVVYTAPVYTLAGLLPLAAMLGLSGISLADDKSDLMEAVNTYFHSEKQGDVQKVWELLAPSSEFKKAYSYPFYQEMIRRNPSVLRDYRIDGVLEIRVNDDKIAFPNVEKIALVQVTVTLAGEGIKEMTQVRVFTFLKESGKWFKG